MLYKLRDLYEQLPDKIGYTLILNENDYEMLKEDLLWTNFMGDIQNEINIETISGVIISEVFKKYYKGIPILIVKESCNTPEFIKFSEFFERIH